MYGVIFLLFNSFRPNLNTVSENEEYINLNLKKIVYLTRKNLANYLKQNKNNLQNIMVNDKKRNYINENHQSAFLPIKLDKLQNAKVCEVYSNLNDFRYSFNP